MVGLKHIPVVRRNGEEHTEERTSSTIRTTEMIFVPTIGLGIMIDGRHTLFCKRTGTPGVDKDYHNIWT